MKIKWGDVRIGDTFQDGSKVLSKHEEYEANCYEVFYSRQSMILSEDHLLLIDISKTGNEIKDWVLKNFSLYTIPEYVDNYVSMSEGKIQSSKLCIVEGCNSLVKENLIWLPVKCIQLILSYGAIIYCNKRRIKRVQYVGRKQVFCVQTDTHHFKTNCLIHHNSVTLRNIIFHCLTHQDRISVALVDLKYTEFTPFKGLKNVIAVANTVQEAVEVLRIAKECMYKRNQEMSKLGINNIADFKPQKPTDNVMITGRKLNDSDMIDVRLPNGEEKQMTVKELEQYL